MRSNKNNSLGLFSLLCLFGLGFVFSTGLYAEEIEPSAIIEEESRIEPPLAEQPPPESPVAIIFESMETPREYIAEKVVIFAKKVDEFFGDERYFQEHNKSVIQFNLNETIGQGGSKTFAFEGQAKIDLPAASKRFHFVFEANPEKKAAGDVKKDQSDSPKETAKPDQYSASVRYEQEEERWHFSSDAGAKFNFPLDPFVRARGSYEIPLWDWRMKTAETVFWFSSIGLGETTQIDFEYVLSPPVLFRATSTATCYETPQLCDLRQDFSVFQTLSERAAMLYQASTIGVNTPVLQETEHILLLRYRYRLHKQWVFAEISPQLHFPRSDGFKLNTLLLLRLEMLIGGT
jgi:hypothetical protein